MNFLKAEVEIVVDKSKLPSQLASIKRSVSTTVSKIESLFKRMSTSFRAAWTKMVRYAKVAIVAIVAGLALTVRAAMKQEQAYAKLAVVLKSTGHAAGLSRQELIAHSEALQSVTEFGDESIQSMQALLLTFKSIRGDTFKRTTEAVLDLSTAMGQDLQQSVIQIGKAINDPVLGMTALRRVGIQFTTSQENLIKSLVESGKLFEAQDVILGELESQFGGMSKIVDTASGRWAQMKNALGDVAEEIGAALLPAFKDTTTGIKEWAESNKETIGIWAQRAVIHITYAKDVLVAFVSYLRSDFQSGVEYALNVTLELFKGFGRSVAEIIKSAMAEAISINTLKGIMNIARKNAQAARTAVGSAAKGAFFSGMGKIADTLGFERHRDKAESTQTKMITEGATLRSKLAKVMAETRTNIADIQAPEELAQKFSKASVKMQESLANVKTSTIELQTVAEKIQEPTTEALIAPAVATMEVYKRMPDAMDEWATYLRESMVNSARYTAEKLRETFEAIEWNLSSAFASMINDGAKWRDALSQFVSDVGRAFGRMASDMAARSIMAGFSDTFGGVLGTQATVAHSGGTIGKTPLPTRVVNSSLFGALKNDEFPAILQRGEKVTAKGQSPESTVNNYYSTTNNIKALDSQDVRQALTKERRFISDLNVTSARGNHKNRRMES
ncbi:phage tail length tape measure family protein [Candidatus Pacearchaeota archaeon]|nr:phage tail length tape measure family protein [Candidatus Pacearchaeota archaeon]